MPKHRIQGSPQTVKIMSNSQRISQIVGQIVKTQGNGSIYAFSGFDDISRTFYLIARGPKVGSGPERNNPKLRSAKVDSGSGTELSENPKRKSGLRIGPHFSHFDPWRHGSN